MSRLPRTRAAERGFSLAEVTVALAVTSLLFVAALSMLSIDQRIYHNDDAVLEAAREGRYIVETLERDLLMAGYQVDVRTIADLGPDGTANTDDDILGQPQIAYAAPYELVFNADVDPAIDAIKDGLTGDSVPTGYAPVTFHTGAETIRYTLDSTGDGTIDASDRGDDMDEAVTENSGLYLLVREVYGYNGSDNANASGPVGIVRGPVAYPNSSRAVPLFLYWGHFDSDPALDLWGDNGTGSAIANNGTLEADEIAALIPVTDEDADDDATLDSGEDRNGNGTLERRASDLIANIQVHVTTETSYPDIKYEDPARSGSTTPFHYHVITTNTEIKPRNTDLPGGACGDEPERTTSPTVVNACPHSLADGKVRVNWNLSADDGNYEDDIEKYVLWRTDVNSIFGPTPYDEVIAGTGQWEDDFIEMRTWPPRQYWYRVRAMDCTPQLSRLDPIAGPYPASPGPAYPPVFGVRDVAGDNGTNLQVVWRKSPDDPANTTGYGDDLKEYHVYRDTDSDYRCKEPVNNSPVTATGAPFYTYTDNGTNSSSALVYGELYYYWLRSRDTLNVLSPYSPRGCARPYLGPVFPEEQEARIVNYGSSDHPAEISFIPSSRNDSAGYDPYLIAYNVYRAPDLDSDGYYNDMTDIAVGYRASDLVATLNWNGIFWAVGQGGTEEIFHSHYPGMVSRTQTNPSMQPLEAIDFHTHRAGVAVGASGTVLTTADGGVNWTQQSAGVAQTLYDVAWVDEDVVVAVGDGGTIVRSADRGATWTVVGSPIADRLTSADVYGNDVWIGAEGGSVLVSIDAGLTFNQSLTYPGPDDVYDVCAAAGGVVYASTIDKVMHSTDSGGTWHSHDFTGEGKMVAIDCLDSGEAIVASHSNDSVFMSGDGGVTWSPVGISPNDPMAVGLVSARLAWVADQNGDVFYRDSTNSWAIMNLESGLDVRDLAVRPEIVWEDSSTNSDSSGTPYYYVVTSYYAQGVSLDGESGMVPDQPSSVETPDDSDDQILVDSCNSIQLEVVQP